MRFEVVIKDVKTRITVAQDRLTLKINPDQEHISSRLVRFAKQVEEVIRPQFDFTRRGRVGVTKEGRLKVAMLLNGKDKQAIYVEEYRSCGNCGHRIGEECDFHGGRECYEDDICDEWIDA